MKKLVVFASGNGSNFEAISRYKNDIYKVVVLICDKKNAYCIERARKLNIPVYLFSLSDYVDKESYEKAILSILNEYNVDFIVLAGYMKLVGKVLLEAFPNKIVNIHPSLLPCFPGKSAIRDAFKYGVKVTGVTIHYVDKGMDTGPIICQKVIKVNDGESLEGLESRIHRLEHTWYKEVLIDILGGKNC